MYASLGCTYVGKDRFGFGFGGTGKKSNSSQFDEYGEVSPEAYHVCQAPQQLGVVMCCLFTYTAVAIPMCVCVSSSVVTSCTVKHVQHVLRVCVCVCV